jgi:polysaccharide biosynthesis protein PelG
MAGIGFRLQSLVRRGTVLGTTTAYLSATIITAGPWLSGVVTLLVMEKTTSSYLSEADRSLLFATIVTLFAASLIVAGGPQMLITRYVADRIYLKDVPGIAATSAGVLFLFIPFTLISLPFLLFAHFSLHYRLLVTTLFLTLTMICIIMIFLSAVYRYIDILLVFLGSYAVSIVASLILGPRYGLLGSLGGFTAGQLLCLSLLIMLIYREFPSGNGAQSEEEDEHASSDKKNASSPRQSALGNAVSFAYLGYVRKYWNLLIIGVFYATSLWIDSFIFWASPHGVIISDFYHLFPPYDIAKFIAAISTIPGAVIFIVHLETNFDRHYQSFYHSIHNRKTLSDMVQAREGMREAVYKGLSLLLKVQGLFAIFLCLIARDLAVFLSLPPTWVPLLRMCILAGTCQFIIFVAMLLLLYIDQRRATMVFVGFFLLCNLLLTLLTLRLGPTFYGAGNLLATGIGAIVGLLLLNSRLRHLERLTFMTQPMV